MWVHWSPRCTTGRFALIQKIATSCFLSSSTRSPHFYLPYRFLEISTELGFYITPQSQLSLPGLYTSMPPTRSLMFPIHPQSTHNTYSISFVHRDGCIPLETSLLFGLSGIVDCTMIILHLTANTHTHHVFLSESELPQSG